MSKQNENRVKPAETELKDKLVQICEELRQFIVDNVSVYGGHFGASLGVVELTVALHYVLNTPEDQLVWDVGHQAYPHKLITGRYHDFHTLRQKDGVAGYLKRSENRFDHFGAGHASTSISAALGMALARDMAGDNYKVAAIIGDGAMTGGMALEAINHAGHLPHTNLLVVLIAGVNRILSAPARPPRLYRANIARDSAKR